MAHDKSDAQMIATTHNTSRYLTKTRTVAWLTLPVGFARRAALAALCYVPIGGLSVATLITLVLVPVLYSVFVNNLKLVKWTEAPATIEGPPSPSAALAA